MQNKKSTTRQDNQQTLKQAKQIQARPKQADPNQAQPSQAQPDQTKPTKQQYHATPFSKYFNALSDIDKGRRYTREFGSILILSLVEEVGEMARAYLAEHGRKRTNIAAQMDETYVQELGDLLVTILRIARIKKINLDEQLTYSLEKIRKRHSQPKV
jgi:NTP pyrophosphatase (non-canonical NTP hydrolase)